MCYVHNQRYNISCATLYIKNIKRPVQNLVAQELPLGAVDP